MEYNLHTCKRDINKNCATCECGSDILISYIIEFLKSENDNEELITKIKEKISETNNYL